MTSYGEVLWDVYPEKERLGGAPANLAFHVVRRGGDGILVTRLGHDERGAQATERLRQASVQLLCGGPSPLPTGVVEVEFAGGQPRYHIAPQSAWDEIQPSEADRELVVTTDAFVFGTLAQRTRSALERLRALTQDLRRKTPGALRVLDLNLRAPYDERSVAFGCLEEANVLKLNEEELERMSKWVNSSEPISLLLERFELRGVLVTRGARGAALYTADEPLVVDAAPSKGSDPVGAGDAFLASFLVQWLRGRPFFEGLSDAARYAAWVAEQPGAMPLDQFDDSSSASSA